jgi:hypothetical protein
LKVELHCPCGAELNVEETRCDSYGDLIAVVTPCNRCLDAMKEDTERTVMKREGLT